MKVKLKFNFVDFAIVAAVVLVATACFVILGGNSSLGAGTEFSYEILFREVPIEVATAAQNGADIFDGVKIINIGKISDSSYEDATKYEFNTLTGEYAYVKVPELYDLTVEVTASGSSNEHSFYVNEYDICVGKRVDVKSVGFVGHGTIVAVKEGE